MCAINVFPRVINYIIVLLRSNFVYVLSFEIINRIIKWKRLKLCYYNNIKSFLEIKYESHLLKNVKSYLHVQYMKLICISHYDFMKITFYLNSYYNYILHVGIHQLLNIWNGSNERWSSRMFYLFSFVNAINTIQRK